MARITTPLSTAAIKALKPKGKTYTVGDGGGLYIRVSPRGVMSWIYRYRKPATKSITNYAFASFPDCRLADARAQAAEFRALVKQGREPQSKVAEAVADSQMTFELVATRWLEHHAQRVDENTNGDIRRTFERHVFPNMGKVPIKDVRAPLAIEVLSPLEKNGNLETLRRLCGNMNRVMRHAVNHGWCEFNPLDSLSTYFKPNQVKHQATISLDELPELMRRLSAANLRAWTKRLILLQLHLMVRPGEAAKMRWEYIGWDEQLITIPAEAMKMRRPFLIPMSTQVVALLQEQRGAVHVNNPWVFPGLRDREAHASTQTANMAIRRMGYSGDELCSHGFRSLATDALLEHGFEPAWVDAMLAHQKAGAGTSSSFAAYARTVYLEQRRKPNQWWSDEITRAQVAALS